jgi:ferric-dicitrate binding protein FerR (iron transport regulator)
MVDAAEKDQTRVYVADGKVLFAKGPEEEGVILTKGMGATIEEGAEMPVVEEVADINSIAWQRGSFIFDQTPLKDVLDCLSKYYHVSFVATDLSKRLSGEFYADDLDLIIELIESALDVTIIKR